MLEFKIPDVDAGDLVYYRGELRYKNVTIRIPYNWFDLNYNEDTREYIMNIYSDNTYLRHNYSMILMNTLKCVFECDSITQNLAKQSPVDSWDINDGPLYNYQINDVLWMESIEARVNEGIKISDYLANSSLIYDADFELRPEEIDNVEVMVRGGNFVNEVGLGKTLTMLSLIKRSFDEYRDYYIVDRTLCNYKSKRGVNAGVFCEKASKGDKMFCSQHLRCAFQDTCRILPNLEKFQLRMRGDKYISNATCVFCPSHLVSQWVGEVKKFFGNDINTLVIINSDNFKNLNLYELLGVDLVIISNSMVSKIYANWFNNPEDLDIYTTNFSWQNVHFKRIIYDENHELVNRPKMERITLMDLSSDYIWNVSGTPFPRTYENYLMNLELLSSLPGFRYVNTLDLDVVKSLYRRNTKESIKMEITKMTESVEWIDFLRVEKDIYESYKLSMNNKITKELVQLCCHPELISKTASMIKECSSLEEISEKLLGFNVRELNRLKNLYLAQVNELEVLRRVVTITEEERDQKKIGITNMKALITGTLNKVKAKESLTNYLRKSIEDLARDTSDEECAICLGEFEDKIGILPCGHRFCCECIMNCINKSMCPTCKKVTSRKDLLVLNKEVKEVSVSPELSEVERLAQEVKSSKLAHIIEYIRKLEPEDKCVIFSQWDLLLHKMGEQLKVHGIECVFCEGTVYQRTTSIKKFVNDPFVKVILLSSKNAASGINLVAANKLILIEPVYGNKEYKENIENQAVGRVNRIGQERDVDIVRFLVRGTVEEQISQGVEKLNFKI